jgi:hypothetical protein
MKGQKHDVEIKKKWLRTVEGNNMEVMWYAAKKFPLKLGYVNRPSARDKKKSQRF